MRIRILSIGLTVGLGLMLLAGACGSKGEESSGEPAEKAEKVKPEKAEPEKTEPVKKVAAPARTEKPDEKIEPVVLDRTGVPESLLGTWEKSEEPLKETRMEFGREGDKTFAMITLPPQTGTVMGAFRLATEAKSEDKNDHSSCMAKIYPINTKIFDEVSVDGDGHVAAKRLVKYFAAVNPCHVVKSSYRTVEVKILKDGTLESTMAPLGKGEPQVELWKKVGDTPGADSAETEEKK